MEKDEMEKLSFSFDLSTILNQILLCRAQIETLTNFVSKNASEEEKKEIDNSIVKLHKDLILELYEERKNKKDSTFVDPRI